MLWLSCWAPEKHRPLTRQHCCGSALPLRRRMFIINNWKTWWYTIKEAPIITRKHEITNSIIGGPLITNYNRWLLVKRIINNKPITKHSPTSNQIDHQATPGIIRKKSARCLWQAKSCWRWPTCWAELERWCVDGGSDGYMMVTTMVVTTMVVTTMVITIVNDVWRRFIDGWWQSTW